MAFEINLSPCADVHIGFDDLQRYEALGLPEEWSIARATGHKWIAPDEYFWTPDDFFLVMPSMTDALLEEIRAKTGGSFFQLGLIKQCELLGLNYISKHPKLMFDETEGKLSYADPVERFSLNYYKHFGWSGESREGSSIFLILFCFRKVLEQKNILQHGLYNSKVFQADRSSKGIFTRDSISPEEHTVIDGLIEKLDEEKIEYIYSIWEKSPRKFPTPRGLAPDNFSLSDLIAVWQGLTPKLIKGLVELELFGFGGLGWPDLTMSKEGRMQFTEVKQTSDKLTHRQGYWARNIAKPLILDPSVLHITHALKKQMLSM